jgi:CBS domain-containing protein
LHKLILRDPLSQLNAPEPIILRRDDSVATAVARMRDARFGSVLVVDDEGSLVGIFTEHDSLGRVDRDRRSVEEVSLEEVMTRDPDSLRASDTIALALNRMSAGGYRHVPIVRDGKPTGFCSIRGILRYISENALVES